MRSPPARSAAPATSLTACAPAARIDASLASQSDGSENGECSETTIRSRSGNASRSPSRPRACSTSTVAPEAYASSTSRRYSSAEPEKLPPSASERHVRIAGRGSSAASDAAGIGFSARSIRNSIAFAPAGTRATRRLASAASFGASDAMCAGIGRMLFAMKIKNPRALSGRGFELSSFWCAPAESCRQGIRPTGFAPATTSREPNQVRRSRRDHPARRGWCQGRRLGWRLTRPGGSGRRGGMKYQRQHRARAR